MSGVETITLSELSEHMKDAEIEVLEESVDLEPIVSQLKALVAKKSDDAKILALMDQLVTAVKAVNITVQPTDLKPVLDAVRLIKSTPPPPVVVKNAPVPYRAVVHRDNRNAIETVDFIPILTPTGEEVG